MSRDYLRKVAAVTSMSYAALVSALDAREMILPPTDLVEAHRPELVKLDGSPLFGPSVADIFGAMIPGAIGAVMHHGVVGGANPAGAVWSAIAVGSGTVNWTAAALSADGSKAYFVNENDNYAWYSSNTGASWTAQTTAGNSSSYGISTSSDGTKAVRTSAGGNIYTSVNSGSTWASRSSNPSWYSVASSADGSKVLASTAGGPTKYLYTSNDGGITFSAQTSAGSRNWRGVASSADGSKLFAVNADGSIYYSGDYGATWNLSTGLSSLSFSGVCCSADGAIVYAVASDAISASDYAVWKSTNSGVSFSAIASLGTSINAVSICCSADGKVVMFGKRSGNIHTSTDFGANWIAQSGSGSRLWIAVGMNAAGTVMMAGSDSSANIYVSLA